MNALIRVVMTFKFIQYVATLTGLVETLNNRDWTLSMVGKQRGKSQPRTGTAEAMALECDAGATRI